MSIYNGSSSIPCRIKGLSVEQTSELLPDNVILLGYRGSIAHGMYVPSSDPLSIDDKDIMGVAFGPRSMYLGLDLFEQKERFIGEYDAVTYELKKYVRLLMNCNPNVLGLLWLNEEHYIHRCADGNLLIKNRDLFSTKRIFHSFTGYAYGQLKRMTHSKFCGYMGEKRKALVEKFGYDTKNAAHCIRLLRMGIEFLRDGILHVCRPDAQQLLQIKRGEWTLEQMKAEAARLFTRAEEAYDRCTLPAEPDKGKVNELLETMLESYLSVRPTVLSAENLKMAERIAELEKRQGEPDGYKGGLERRVGKKAAGHLLDGVEYREFPEVIR